MSETPSGFLSATGTVSNLPISYGDLELYEGFQRYEVGSTVTYTWSDVEHSYRVVSAERTDRGWHYQVTLIDAAD